MLNLKYTKNPYFGSKKTPLEKNLLTSCFRWQLHTFFNSSSVWHAKWKLSSRSSFALAFPWKSQGRHCRKCRSRHFRRQFHTFCTFCYFWRIALAHLVGFSICYMRSPKTPAGSKSGSLQQQFLTTVTHFCLVFLFFLGPFRAFILSAIKKITSFME